MERFCALKSLMILLMVLTNDYNDNGDGDELLSVIETIQIYTYIACFDQSIENS